MRKCDNCGKELPLGTDIIEVRCIGFKSFKHRDFCRPICFQKFYLKEEVESRKFARLSPFTFRYGKGEKH